MTEKEELIADVRNKLMAFTMLLGKLEKEPVIVALFKDDIDLANKGIAKILEM